MNKLWVRLTLAFGLVIAMAIIIVAVLGNYQVGSQFRRFMFHNQVMQSSLGPALIDYYSQNGTWTGVETVLSGLPGPGMGHGQRMRRGMPKFTLIDTTGWVVYDETGKKKVATHLSQREISRAVPIEWQDQTIGYLVFSGPPGQLMLSGPAQTFINQTPRLFLQAGLIAAGLAVLMGLIFARGLSAPLGRLATAARRISRGELDQRVPVKGADELADLAHAFNEMAANLQQGEIMRRNLVADVAHELRTPLSVIQGNLQAILDDVYPLEKAEIAAIYDETLVLSRLINDLRELAQAEAGQLSLNIQPTKLAPLIAGATDLFAELAREQEINLTVTLPDHLPAVLADPDRVRQVLHNLLSNALRHTPPGGTIGIVVAETEAEPGGRGAGKQGDLSHFVRMSVTDTGPGIAAEDLPHIFDRFWRADKSRSREHGGSGLGLAIARQLIEAQDGQIGVESKGTLDRGSRFWFTLPVV